MEGKRKDVNQLYREMEEAVAQKVRETMELADARRKALAQSAFIDNQREMIRSFDNRKGILQEAGLVTTTEHIDNRINENKDTIRIQEIVDSDDHLKKEEIQQEFCDINRSIEEEQAKMYRAVEDAKTKAKDTEEEVQTGFEQSKIIGSAEKDSSEYKESCPTQTDTATIILNETQKVKDKDCLPEEIEHCGELKYIKSIQRCDEQTPQIGFEHFENPTINDPPYQQSNDTNDFESKHELAQGALNLARDGIRSTKNISQEAANTTRVTETVQTITNNPFDLIEDTDAELRRMGEDALSLAETSVRNYSTNPFESSDDEVEIRLGEGTITMVQNNWRSQTRNPFESIDDPTEIRQMGEEALSIAQNASRNYAINPFNMLHDEEMRQIGVDALNIAQKGATKQLSENAEDIDNAFNSLVDSSHFQTPVVEIGFDHFQNTFDVPDTDDSAADL